MCEIKNKRIENDNDKSGEYIDRIIDKRVDTSIFMTFDKVDKTTNHMKNLEIAENILSIDGSSHDSLFL